MSELEKQDKIKDETYHELTFPDQLPRVKESF
jgi:hypothetical protein